MDFFDSLEKVINMSQDMDSEKSGEVDSNLKVMRDAYNELADQLETKTNDYNDLRQKYTENFLNQNKEEVVKTEPTQSTVEPEIKFEDLDFTGKNE